MKLSAVVGENQKTWEESGRGRVAMMAGVCLLGTLTATLFIAVFGYWTRLDLLGANTLWFALVVAVVFTIGIFRKESRWQELIAAGLLVVVALSASYLLSISMYDFSNDGMQYHQVAYWDLGQDWNPIVQPDHDNFKVRKHNKGVYILAASWYLASGSFAAGKAPNTVVWFSSFFLLYSLLRRHTKMGTPWCLILSIVACLNPVWTTEASLFFVDGFLYCALLILITALTRLALEGTMSSLLFVFLSICLAVSIKLTGLVFVCVLLLSFGLIHWFVLKAGIKTSILLGVFLFFSVAVLNYNPFVTNFIKRGNVFGSDIEKTTERWQSYSLADRLRFFVVSACMAPSDIPKGTGRYRYSPENVKTILELSNPIAHRFRNIGESLGLISRLGGYTQLFGLALFLSLAAFLLMLWKQRKLALIMLCYIVPIFASVLIIQVSFWFRYVPQVWLLPLIAAAFCMARGGRGLRLIGVALVVLMGYLGGAFAFATLTYNWQEAVVLRQQIKQIREMPEPIRIYFPKTRSVKKHFLTSLGIDFVEAENKVDSDLYITRRTRQQSGIVFR